MTHYRSPLAPRIFVCLLIDDTVAGLPQAVRQASEAADFIVLAERLRHPRAQSRVRREWQSLRPHFGKLRHVTVVDGGSRLDPLLAELPRGLRDAERGDTVVVLAAGTGLDATNIAKPATPDFPGIAFQIDGAPLAEMLRHHAASPGASRLRGALARRTPAVAGYDGNPPIAERQPVILCCHVHDKDRSTVTAAFGLDEPRGSHLPFAFWKDEERIGPERAFQKGWQEFPGRDVIIIHPDMRPLPGDLRNQWYDDLLARTRALPQAGIVGCNLLYPEKALSGRHYVQSAGGYLGSNQIQYIGGRSRLRYHREYDAALHRCREVVWATFGGVYIRREAIDLVGGFDPDYEWAYVMDVDFCLEARLRGFAVYQVPVNLLHNENGTTAEFLQKAGYHDKVNANSAHFFRKWGLVAAPASIASVRPSRPDRWVGAFLRLLSYMKRAA